MAKKEEKKVLTNSGAVIRAEMDRIIDIKFRQAELAEELKDLRTELKSREEDLGITAAELFKAVALHLKGAKEVEVELGERMALLLKAGLIEDAGDVALQ